MGKLWVRPVKKYLISEDLSKSEEVLKRSKWNTNNFKISNQKLERNIWNFIKFDENLEYHYETLEKSQRNQWKIPFVS